MRIFSTRFTLFYYLMNDPAASRPGILEEFSFKSRGKPRGLNPLVGLKRSPS